MGIKGAPEQRGVATPGCAACGQPIPPGTPVGGGTGAVLHLDCYLDTVADARITALIVERPLCVACLADGLRAAPSTIEARVDRIASWIVVYTEIGACALCERVGPLVSIQRP
jgi:hypothetical protein